MPLRSRLVTASALLLFLPALAGCLAEEPAPTVTRPPSAFKLSTSLPSMTKLPFLANPATSENGPVEGVLGMAPRMTKAIDVPPGTGKMQIAIDLQPDVAAGSGTTEMAVKFLDSTGATKYEVPNTDRRGKFLHWLEPVAAGKYNLQFTYQGSWKVGYVLVFVPADYTEGILEWVATPNETAITHVFSEPEISVPPGNQTRITLYDYDPHAGIENLQHNIFFPDLNIRTSGGYTTWGEVRVLDFKAPDKPGKYKFFCEQHESQLKGALTVE